MIDGVMINSWVNWGDSGYGGGCGGTDIEARIKINEDVIISNRFTKIGIIVAFDTV